MPDKQQAALPNQTIALYPQAQAQARGEPPPRVTFSGAPKIWVPAAICTDCGYPNDFDYNFCQRCGSPKRDPSQLDRAKRIPVDHMAISQRLEQIKVTQASSAYATQKSALKALLSDFLSTFSPPKNVACASPVDVVKFLIWKDEKGKTKVHEKGCVGRQRSCQCPARLAFKTVDSYIGKLRAIFSENGRGGEWDGRLGVGNPAASKEVKQYLASVTAEQLGQGLTPQQARPVFLSKMCEHIAAAFFSGDRIADLMRVRTSDVCRLQSGALLMNHVWGKTLRDGRSNVFTMEKTGDSSTCPVVAIDWYVAISKYLSISLDGGFLFRSTSREGEVLAEQPSSAAVNNSFRRYLRKLDIDEGETLHGCRAGCAISLHMAGASEGEVMGHIGWFTKQTASHYMKIAKVTQPGGPATRLAAEEVQEAVKSYEENNELLGLT
ncbi:hypothetical protein Bbelb_117340 [Branchiostoma belcheri]|nr:hypothetical protein Bbelb_117340 [Branchiostoma belcheri]